jgi:negative regulator of sigma E activity
VLTPTYLPKGYELDGSYLFHCPNCHDTAAETRYTNGMDSFSVFQGSSSLTQHGVGSVHGLAKVGNRQVLVWAHRDSHYALLGDLPLDTLRRIAASLPGGDKATSRGE